MKACKVRMGEGLCENIGNVVMTRDTPNRDRAVFNMLTYKVVANIDVFAV